MLFLGLRRGGGGGVMTSMSGLFQLVLLGFVCYMPENVAWPQDLYYSRLTRFAVVSVLLRLSNTTLT